MSGIIIPYQLLFFYMPQHWTQAIESNTGGSNPTPPPVVIARSPILDTVTSAKFAFSFSKLRTGYSGSAIRVRNSNNTELDIGFKNDGSFDTDTYTAHVNAGDGTGYVVKWYDQSTGANHLLQATAANQPTVLLSGQNGQPAVKFVAAASQVMDTADFASAPAVATMSMVAAYGGTYNDGLTGAFVSYKASANRFQLYKQSVGQFAFFQGGTILATAEGDNTLSNILTAAFNGSTASGSYLRINGGTAITGTLTATTMKGLRVGADPTPTYMTGTISELIGYASILTTANVNLVGQNQSSWFKIPYMTAVSTKTITNVTKYDLEASVIRLANGNLLASYTEAPNAPASFTQGAVLHVRFSSDNGATWSAEDTYLDSTPVTGFPMSPPGATGSQGAGEPFLYIAPNGDLLIHTWLSDYSTSPSGQSGSFQARCTDGIGKVWSAMSQITFANFPGGYTHNNNYIFSTDDYFTNGDGKIYAASRMLQAGNAASSGVVKQQFISSPDNGTTWNYVSDISSYTSAVGGANGTIEVGLAYIGGTTIVAVLRGQIGDSNGYMSVSTDMGATWNGGSQTAPGALTVITGKSLHTGRLRNKSFLRLYGQSTWWTDSRIVMCGFAGSDSGRRPCIWVSYDSGSTWGHPMWLDTADGTNKQGYGDMFYDSTNKQLVVLTTSYNTPNAKRVINQYNVDLYGLNGS